MSPNHWIHRSQQVNTHKAEELCKKLAVGLHRRRLKKFFIPSVIYKRPRRGHKSEETVEGDAGPEGVDTIANC